MSDTSTPLGDRHCGKQTELIYKDGKRFVRKARPAVTERAYHEFCRVLSENGFSDFPECATIIREDASSHDEEYIENTPTTPDGVKRYFFRSGALVFFAYLFASTDFHAENIIACGDIPYIVDMETLFSGKETERGKSPRLYNLTDTVAKSHLLPNFIRTEENLADCGGITGTINGSTNLPVCDGVKVQPWSYKKNIIDGFCSAYRFTLENRKLIYDLLELFGECNFRQILRPTATYGAIIDYLNKTSPEKRSDTAYALLSRAYKNDIDPSRINTAADILNSEIKAVLQGDIPVFFVRGNSLDLFDADGVVFNNHLVVSPVMNARMLLDSFCVSDMEEQSRIISLMLSTITPLQTTEIYSASQKTFISALDNSSVFSLPSVWTKLNYDMRGNLFFESAGFGLYDGLTGIALCYAAAFKKTGDAEFIKRIDTCLAQYIENKVLPEAKIPLTQYSCSLENGVAGQIAALLHISALTGEKRFASYAQRLFDRLIIEDSISLPCDLLGGVAGLALQLPRLDISRNISLAGKIADMIASSEVTLTGAAHGVAGTALALGSAGFALGTDKYDEKTIALLDFENGYYSDESNNWFDLRDASKHGFMRGWCSGAPGIGMTRKKLMSYTNNSDIISRCQLDINRAKRFLGENIITKSHTLCCGTASRVMAASCLEVDCSESLQTLLSTPLLKLALHINDTNDSNMSLMQGLSGIGYAYYMYGDTLSGDMLI